MDQYISLTVSLTTVKYSNDINCLCKATDNLTSSSSPEDFCLPVKVRPIV